VTVADRGYGPLEYTWKRRRGVGMAGGSGVSTRAASPAVPSLHEAVGVVSNDLSNRTLTVRLSDQANGFTRLLWKEAFRALRSAEEGGWRNSHSTVYASAGTSFRVASAVCGNGDFGGMLKFVFPSGEPSYSQLVGKPGLSASVWLDRERHRFVNVSFHNRGS
jgi:hypothetical protein